MPRAPMHAKTKPSSSAPTGSTLPAPGDEHAFYVIDISGYVFRAYHALPPLSTAKGEPTHAVYGATQMIKKLIDDRRPAHLAVAMDARGGAAFRKEIDARYKATRNEPPPDLHSQMRRCEEVVRAYRIPIFHADGFEADDLIATFTARALRDPQNHVVIVSSDKDLMQLVGQRVVLYDTMRERVYGAPEVVEKFGVPPESLRDLLALMGDSSDNVPGVPHVGPKTAADLIKRFGSIESMYEGLHGPNDCGIKGKLRENLLAHEAEARVSQRLVSLRLDADLPFDPKTLAYSPPTGDVAKELRQLFSDLEFTRLVDKLEVARAVTRVYRTLASLDDLKTFASELRASDSPLSIAVQATSDRSVDAKPIGLALAFEPGKSVYLPIAHRYLGAPKQLSMVDVKEVLGPIFADPNVPKIGHDLKRVVEVMKVAGVPLSIAHPASFDVLLAQYLVDPEAPSELRELAQSELQHSMKTYDQTTHKDAVRRGSQLAFDEVSCDEACEFLAGEADVARELAERLAQRIEGAGLGKLFRDVEMPLTSVLAEMELAGVLVDVDRLKKLSVEVDQQLKSLEEKAREILRESKAPDDVVRDFNLGSPRQLEAILFDALSLPVIKRTKTGRSTDADVLEELSEKHALPGVILEHRQIAKLKGTYLDALPKLVSPSTGRIHTTYDQHVAATGRLSSTDPNLQNIPIRTELGKKIRAAFVAPPGFVLMSADYSQIELRILAHLSEDPILTDAFRKNEDIHTRTARELFGPQASEARSPETNSRLAGANSRSTADGTADWKPNAEHRRRAKAVNFGVVYGQGDSALAKSLGIPRGEAAAFIARYFERYAGVAKYMDAQIEVARKGEGVRTLLGRRRFLADIHSANRALRLAAERIARNTPIQGTAADVLKLAMLALKDPIVPGARMLLTVHDELVFEVPEARVEEAAKIVREKMESVVKLAVPLLVEVGWGSDWATAKA